MPRGGARPGSGRPRGSKDSRPRRWQIPSFAPGTRSEFIAYCKEVCQSGDAVAVVAAALHSDDAAERFRALQLVTAYALGTPTAHVKVEQAKGLDEQLLAWHKELEAAPTPPSEERTVVTGDDEDDEADA